MRWLLPYALLASAACSHAQVQEPGRNRADEDRAVTAALQQRADGLERTLASLAVGSGSPDCARACELAGEICELSRRISAIADRHAGDQELAGRCVASADRCRRSRDRVSPQCGCAK